MPSRPRRCTLNGRGSRGRPFLSCKDHCPWLRAWLPSPDIVRKAAIAFWHGASLTLLTLPALALTRERRPCGSSFVTSHPHRWMHPVLQGARTENLPTSQLANTTLEQPGQLRNSQADLPNAPTHPVVSAAQCDMLSACCAFGADVPTGPLPCRLLKQQQAGLLKHHGLPARPYLLETPYRSQRRHSCNDQQRAARGPHQAAATVGCRPLPSLRKHTQDVAPFVCRRTAKRRALPGSRCRLCETAALEAADMAQRQPQSWPVRIAQGLRRQQGAICHAP